MRIGSLFSGIGGLELGLEWAGVGHVVWQVERDPFARSVLARHWPDADRSIEDVTIAGAANLAPVDVICGGFPCQDISTAGKGAGLAGERSGLWFEYLRIVRELRPRFVVVENVAALLGRGLDTVLGGLAEAGYDAEWFCLRASDVGAPHRRERLFVVAHAGCWCVQCRRKRRIVGASHGEARDKHDDARHCGEVVADADPLGLRDAPTVGELGGERSPVSSRRRRETATQRSQPRMGRAPHGLPARLDRWPAGPGEPQHEWEAPRVAQGVPNRAARLKALGNAVVPQVAEVVGRVVLEIVRGRP